MSKGTAIRILVPSIFFCAAGAFWYCAWISHVWRGPASFWACLLSWAVVPTLIGGGIGAITGHFWRWLVGAAAASGLVLAYIMARL